MKRSAYQWGLDHYSCEIALIERKKLGENKTQADWWKVCNRGEWLIWQLGKLPPDKFLVTRPLLLRAVGKIADRAVTNHALNCGIPEVESWAKKWLSGEDKIANSAWAAVEAARMAEATETTINTTRIAGATAKAAEAVAEAAEVWAAIGAAEAAEVAAEAAEVWTSIWAARAMWATVRAAGVAARAAAEAAGTIEVTEPIKAAEATAFAAEQKQQADDIRQLIPEWPGKL